MNPVPNWIHAVCGKPEADCTCRPPTPPADTDRKIAHINPNCIDATRCKPHGEDGPVEYYPLSADTEKRRCEHPTCAASYHGKPHTKEQCANGVECCHAADTEKEWREAHHSIPSWMRNYGIEDDGLLTAPEVEELLGAFLYEHKDALLTRTRQAALEEAAGAVTWELGGAKTSQIRKVIRSLTQTKNK